MKTKKGYYLIVTLWRKIYILLKRHYTMVSDAKRLLNNKNALIKYVPIELRRKLIGESGCYRVSLPKDWVNMVKSEYGDFKQVDMLVRDTVVIIRPVFEEE